LNEIYILDACALIALLAKEKGHEKVRFIIQEAIDGYATVKMNQINLLEVYYDVCKVYDQNEAN
jgi:PIN domain nuclease of toxin-antitoxin system